MRGGSERVKVPDDGGCTKKQGIEIKAVIIAVTTFKEVSQTKHSPSKDNE